MTTSDMPSKKHIIVWEDLWYVVRWWLTSEYVVNFEVFNINAISCSSIDNDGVETPCGTKGCPPGVSLSKRNAIDGMAQADDFDDAEVSVSGFIKWDGCSHVEFPDAKTCMMHLCGRGNWMQFSQMMMLVFDTLAPMIPKIDRDCSGLEQKP